MSRTEQIIWGALAFILVIFFLIPMLPVVYAIKEIITIIVIVAAIFWVLRLGGIAVP